MKSYALGTVLLYLALAGCSVSTAMTGASLAFDHRSLSQSINQNLQNIRAKNAIARDPQLANYTTITVSIFNDMALMTGQAPNEELKMRAEDIVSKYVKKDELYNEVTIGMPLSKDQNFADSIITGKILSKIALSKDVSPSDIKIITSNHNVFLMGVLPTREAQAATILAKSTPGVKTVVRIMNYLDRVKTMPAEDTMA